MKNSHIQYRPDIDGMRALAVLAVVLFHAFPNIAPGGFIGVDIFFVISGFLITSIISTNLEKGQFSFFDFYSRRIKRIFPSLILVLVSTFILGYFLLIPSELEQVGKHILSGAIFTSNLTLWGEAGYFDISSDSKPLLHLWSLAIEEQFYILWPLILYFAYKKRLKAILVVSLIGLSSFLYCLYLTKTDPTAAFYSPLSRFWEILVGAFIAIHRNSNKETLKNLKSLLGLAFIIIGFIFTTKNSYFPGGWALLPTIGAAFIISAGPNSWLNRKVLSQPLLVGVGLISYPLYLWHWPLLSIINLISTESPTIWIRLSAVIASFGLAWITNRTLETYFKSNQKIKFKTYALSFCMILVGTLGLFIDDSNGLPNRYPSEVQAIAEKTSLADFQWEEKVRTHTCHIQNPETDKRPNECIESARPLVVLWGDSHAAALYPGLKNLQKSAQFGIAQLTHVGNPPRFIEKEATGKYEINNQDVFRSIILNKPEILILHAAWFEYNKTPKETADEIKKTISKIRASLPSTQIVVIGPVPTWRDSLQKNILKHFMSSSPTIPEYFDFGLKKEVISFDKELDSLLSKEKIHYFSLINIFCRNQQCLTRTGPSHLDLTAVDYGHLSEAGSNYFAKHFEAYLNAEIAKDRN